MKKVSLLIICLLLCLFIVACDAQPIANTVEEKTNESGGEDLSFKTALSDLIIKYSNIINAYEAKKSGDEREYNYELIYFDEDDFPELLVGVKGFHVCMYTYKNGNIFNTMSNGSETEQSPLGWTFGVGGNHGYEYAPKKNVMRNVTSEFAGIVEYITYYKLNNENVLEDCTDGILYVARFEDANENRIFDPGEEYSEDNMIYYLDDVEISKEEFEAHSVNEDFKFISLNETADEIITELKYLMVSN